MAFALRLLTGPVSQGAAGETRTLVKRSAFTELPPSGAGRVLSGRIRVGLRYANRIESGDLS